MNSPRRQLAGKSPDEVADFMAGVSPGSPDDQIGLERNVLRLERALQDGTWRGPAAKRSSKCATPSREESPQRRSATGSCTALCAVVEPIFERGCAPGSPMLRKPIRGDLAMRSFGRVGSIRHWWIYPPAREA